MRVVWNLISSTGKDGRPQIRTTQLMLDAMDIVESIPDTHDVYNVLQKIPISNANSDIKRRLNEEIIKAKQILNGGPRNDGKTWEEVIIDAENYSFFKGTIDFLYHDESGNIDWGNFDAKFESAKEKFAGGKNNAELTEFAKQFKEEELYKAWNTTLSFNNCNDYLWKYILSENSYRKQVHHFLMNTVPDTPCTSLLDIIDIICASGQKELWILGDWNSCKHVLTNYVQRRNYTPFGYVYEVGGSRNSVLQRLEGDSEIQIEFSYNAVGKECYELAGKKYYRGLVINLRYANNIFAYYGNNTICLLKDDGVSKDEFDQSANYFVVPENASCDDIKNGLKLILEKKEEYQSTIEFAS